MNFSEAARIMMSNNPVIKSLFITSNGTYYAPTGVDGYNPITVEVPTSDGGIWDKLDNIVAKVEPLAIIVLAPNTLVRVYDLGGLLNAYINKDLDDNGIPYLQAIGNRINVSFVITYKGKPVYYYPGGQSGDLYINEFLSSGYCYFNRRVQVGAINVKSCTLSKNTYQSSFSCSIEYYLDYLNFQQAEYEDGSHWEEQYAWCSSKFTTNFNFPFYGNYPSHSFNNYFRGNDIYEQYDNINNIGYDVCNGPDVYPILSYTKAENHFSEDYYTNETAKNKGYYDSNVAYMEKWGTPELWT